MRKQAIVNVTPELLVESMKFPRGTEIIRCRVAENGDIELVCQHYSLPDTPEGNILPRLTPVIEHTREHFKFYWSNEDFKNGKETM